MKELITDGGLLASLEENQRWRKKTLSIDLPPSQLCPLEPQQGVLSWSKDDVFRSSVCWELGLISSDHNGLLIRRSIKILGHTYQNHGSHDAAFFPPLAKRRTGEGFYVNSGSAIPGHTLLLAHFPCMRYQTWDQGTWRLLPANIVQTLPAGEGLHGRLYLRNKIHKMYEIHIWDRTCLSI